MMLGLVAFTGAFVAMASIGLVAVGTKARERRWRTRAPATRERSTVSFATGPAFEPMDIPAESSPWPSGRAYREPYIDFDAVPWPSERWDDPYFGVNARKRQEILGQQAEAPRAQQKPKPQPKAKPQPKPKPQPRAKPQPQQRARPPVTEDRTEQQFFQEPPASPRRGDAPDFHEILALVDQLGLAGAVDEIRRRTGWDFKRAAQYVAQSLKQR